MIIECENCQSKFNLDEALIKETGSKVRCSKCKNIFTVYPPQPEMNEANDEESSQDNLMEELEETVALDSPPVFDQAEEEGPASEEPETADFDQAFQKAIEEEGLEEAAIDEPFGKEEAVPGETPDRAEAIMEGPAPEEKRIRDKKDKKARAVSGERKKFSFSRLLFIILGIILFLIIIFAVFYFFFPNYLPDFLGSPKEVREEILTDKGTKNLNFKEVSGSFIQSAVDGRRFVIRGKIINHYPGPRSYILVQAEILDEKGRVIRKKMAYTGNVFTENELKNMPMDAIDAILKNRLGRNKMNVNIMPEAEVPFMVVFEDLPPNLSEFSVEAVSSLPEE